MSPELFENQVYELRTPHDERDAKDMLRRARKNIKRLEAERREAEESGYSLGVRAADESLSYYRAVEKHTLKYMMPKLLENQATPNAVGYLVLAGFAAAALYALFRPKKAAAATAALPMPAMCTLETTQDFDRLERWAVANKIGVIYLPADTTPPSSQSELGKGIARSAADLVVVMSDGSFWTYKTGEPVLAPVEREAYCSFKPATGVSGISWIGD